MKSQEEFYQFSIVEEDGIRIYQLNKVSFPKFSAKIKFDERFQEFYDIEWLDNTDGIDIEKELDLAIDYTHLWLLEIGAFNK